MRAACGVFAVMLLAGCAQPATTTTSTGDRELAALQPLKQHYSDVIQGMDAGGKTLDIFVNEDQLNSIDPSVEDQFKAEALRRWRTVWQNANPGKRATVRIRLRKYFGQTLFSESANV
ncbi:MAG TPA: hypothetical protein VGR69_00940 [Candidatus Rubrimentiphilum sp.]|nr:hypothetical protein [Candidatus Rubrimentiphilum sp.]